MEAVSLQLSWFAYLLASGGYVVTLLRPRDWARRVGPLLLGAAFSLHSLFLAVRTLETGAVPATNATEGLALFAWLLVGVYLCVQSRFHLAVIGAVVSPLAFVMTFGASALYGGGGTVPDALRSPWLVTHIILAFLGNAVFGLAFAVSVVQLLQERLLKTHRRTSLVRRLPPVGKLDRLNYLFLLWGFALMTLGIVTGGVWATNVWGRFWSWEPREILSIVTWILYAGLLQLRTTGGLTGRRAARWTVLAYFLLIVFFLAVNLLPFAGNHGGGLGG